MITVLTGTQSMPFSRLIDAVIDFCIETKVNEEVCIQTGSYKLSRTVPRNISVFEFDTQEAINDLLRRSSIVITHGGTGSIIGSLSKFTKVIVMPRLSEFGEHNDDHQVEIAELFEQLNYILYWRKSENLQEVFSRLELFKPASYVSDFDCLKESLLLDVETYLNE